MRVDRQGAVHEAAHAVGCMTFDRLFHSVVLGNDDRLTVSGEIVRSGGAVLCASTYVPGAYQEREYMEDSVLIALAGPAAQAKFGKVSLAGVYIGPGRNDFKYVKKCLADFDICHLFDEFERRAKAFVRQHWTSIMTVADRLALDRRLTHDQVGALLQ